MAAAGGGVVEKLAQLRALLCGSKEADEKGLLELLQRSNYDVNNAAELYFDGAAASSASAPQPWHAAAVPFINAARAHRFKDSKDGRINFTHVNARTAQLPSWKHGSQVLDRLHKTKPRLPSNLYGQP